MNIFKKLSLLKFYRKTIKENKQKLYNDFNVKVDFIGRCYTVVKIPSDIKVIRDIYNQESQEMIYSYIHKKLQKLSHFYKNIGLFEIVGLNNITKISNEYYKIDLEFKFLNLKTVYKVKILLYLISTFGILYISNLLFNFI